jgi:glucokinase
MSDAHLAAPSYPKEGHADLIVDIGGTKVLVALGTAGRVLDRARLPTSGWPTSADLVAAVAGAALDLAGRNGVELRAALVAVPGTIDRAAGTVVSAANLPFRRFPLAASLSQGLDGLEVVIEDDANCGVLGEAAFGSARGSDDAVYVTLSTGIGMGALVNGRLVRGGHGAAGELGHILVVREGRLCGCGRRGCLEAYASGSGIAGQGRELLAAGGAPVLAAAVAGPDAVTAREVIAAAAAGDADCAAVLAGAVELFGDALRTVRCVLDPEVVVLGGGLMSNPAFAGLALSAVGTLGAVSVLDAVGGLGGDASPEAGDPSVRAGALGDDSVVLGGLHLLATQHRLALDPQGATT